MGRYSTLIGVLAGVVVTLAVIGITAATLLSAPVPSRGPGSGGATGSAAPSDRPSASPSSSGPTTITPPPSGTDGGAGASGSPGAPTVSPGIGDPPGPSPSLGPSPSDGASPSVGLRIGDRAPGLRVAQLGGGEVDLSAYAGRPVWLNFMATWCPPCRDELPVMQRFQRQLGSDLPIVLVDNREDEQTVSAFLSSLGVELPVGLDRDGAAHQTWGALVLPVHYWVDGSGVIRGYAVGGVGPEQFLEGVRSVLPDATVDL